MNPVDLWAALAALLVAAVLATLAALLELPAEVSGGFFGAATMLVTFAAGAFTRARVQPSPGEEPDHDPD